MVFLDGFWTGFISGILVTLSLLATLSVIASYREEKNRSRTIDLIETIVNKGDSDDSNN